MTPLDTFFLLIVAGFGAGLSGSMAGLASLFSYPALLAAGLSPVTANVTNSVALSFAVIGATASSRPELAGQAPTIKKFALFSAVGGTSGAGLLLLTPPDAFKAVVPILVAGASAILLIQPRLSRAAAANTAPLRTSPAVALGIFCVTVYAGYFGAAAGVLMLALILTGLPLSLLEANAVKNVLAGIANGIAALGFALFADVQWWAVLPLALGLLAGSWVGPSVARRLPASVLRSGIAVAGFGLACVLAVQSY